MNIQTRETSVIFNLDNHHAIETPNVTQMAFDLVKRRYEGTCYDRGYILSIIRDSIVCGERTFRPRCMYGEATMVVKFSYTAYVINEESILHNCKVIKIIRDVLPISITCSPRPFISVTAEILSKVVTEGMIIPVKVIYVGYPQELNNTINVYGDVLHPRSQLFDTIEYSISKPTEAELKEASILIQNAQKNGLRVSSMPRANFFRSFIYPHKTTVNNLSMLDIISTGVVPANFCIQINDTCDATNYEYVKIPKKPHHVNVPFLAIINFLVKSADTLWSDIENLSSTYESDDMFTKHKPLFDYYEKCKDNDENSTLFSEGDESKNSSGGIDEDNVI